MERREYHVYIISYPYPISYHILSLSYHVHQTGPYLIINTLIVLISKREYLVKLNDFVYIQGRLCASAKNP